MNLLKKGVFAILTLGIVMSCDDDTLAPITENTTGTGLTNITFPNLALEDSGDGTIITATPQGLGADYYIVDFGDPNSTSDVITIKELAGSATYDYPNEVEEVTYTITVTAKSNKGLEDVIKTEDITVTHIVESIDTSPASPTEDGRNNVFSIFTDGFEHNGSFISYATGDSVTGAEELLLDSGNSILELSRLGAEAGVLELSDGVVIADAFDEGIGVNIMHMDIHSNFDSGLDVLKITLVDNSNSIDYVADGVALTDGEWAGFDFDLATDFSAPVVQFDEIKIELGTGGTVLGHATINVDNIYLTRTSSESLLNGDFEDGQDFWKWGLFTDGETNPFGSSSDGSNFDIDGNNLGSKTRGAKWSSSQSGGDFRSSSSRYAYQELNLTPGASYILQYQYAIKDDSSDSDPIGGRNVVGIVLDGHYVDGVDAVDNNVPNLGYHQGFIAEGKFSSTTNGEGTLVQVPFTANDSGEIAVMFYAVTPVDAWIDNVKVYAQ